MTNPISPNSFGYYYEDTQQTESRHADSSSSQLDNPTLADTLDPRFVPESLYSNTPQESPVFATVSPTYSPPQFVPTISYAPPAHAQVYSPVVNPTFPLELEQILNMEVDQPFPFTSVVISSTSSDEGSYDLETQEIVTSNSQEGQQNSPIADPLPQTSNFNDTSRELDLEFALELLTPPSQDDRNNFDNLIEATSPTTPPQIVPSCSTSTTLTALPPVRTTSLSVSSEEVQTEESADQAPRHIRVGLHTLIGRAKSLSIAIPNRNLMRADGSFCLDIVDQLKHLQRTFGDLCLSLALHALDLSVREIAKEHSPSLCNKLSTSCQQACFLLNEVIFEQEQREIRNGLRILEKSGVDTSQSPKSLTPSIQGKHRVLKTLLANIDVTINGVTRRLSLQEVYRILSTAIAIYYDDDLKILLETIYSKRELSAACIAYALKHLHPDSTIPEPMDRADIRIPCNISSSRAIEALVLSTKDQRRLLLYRSLSAMYTL